MNAITYSPIPENVKIRPLRFCTGGCSKGNHSAHFYSVDPCDGPLGREYLCPGNLNETREISEIVNGKEVWTLDGFIA